MSGERKKFFFISSALTFAVLLTLAGGSFWAPRFLERNARVLTAARQEFQESGERRAILRRERERRDVLERARDELKAFFVNREDPLPFIEAVESLAAKSGVRVEFALASPGPDREPAMIYALTAAGSYPALMRFFNAFEELPQAIRVAELRLVKEPGVPELRLELTVKTFDARAAL